MAVQPGDGHHIGNVEVTAPALDAERAKVAIVGIGD